tara:strand:- start:153 stop:572 length:420 start_codon:yes stop_codon:yes gene_type:complete
MVGTKGVAHNAAEVEHSEDKLKNDVSSKDSNDSHQKGGRRKTRKGGRRKRRGGRKSRKGGRKSRKVRGGACEDDGTCAGGARRKSRKTKKKRTGKKRKLNPFFKLMLAAKKAGKASFKYGTKLYKGKKHPRLGMIYKRA